jgi:hypothetical protein
MLCKLVRFYPAYTLDGLSKLPKRTLDVMWEAITIIEAQDQLALLSALDWPNMKKQKRQELHRDLHRKAYPSSLREKNYVSIDDLKKIVGR